jgi:S-adenosylmethionine:tRNA ribosyltransferase-isomerase
VLICVNQANFLQEIDKMNPKNLSINDFIYDLPDEKIAKYPLPKRDESKLLIYQNGIIKESLYKDVAAAIGANSLLIFNNTKVVAARLLFEKNTGSVIEIFCLEPSEIYADITTAMLQCNTVQWKCLVGGAKKWKEDDEYLIRLIKTDVTDLVLTAKKIEKRNDYFLIEFAWDNEKLLFSEVLHLAGKIPLPPYLNRAVEENDKQNYQTVYAKQDGSVAAPTAGLHFTNEVLTSLKNKNIDTNFVTLHVGAGTFKPVKANTMDEHEMHAEFIDVELELIEKIISKFGEKIIAVGTTSLRTIESLYWLGVKLYSELQIANYDLENKKQELKNEKQKSDKQEIRNEITSKEKLKTLEIRQWDCYELPQNIEVKKALETLANWMKQNELKRLITKTQIIIAPSYTLRIADGLITNFHQPKSTLLLLVAAIVDNDWKKIYSYALENNYRFLSYGDGCLLWNR